MPDAKRYRERWEALKQERSSWLEHWRELGEQLQPRRPRFLQTDRNKGYKKNDKIINNTPLRAVRTLSSGMMSGITSPARPWFHLIIPDTNKSSAVDQWIYEVERRMLQVMARSNLYNALPLVYADIGVFGTSAMIIEEDEQDVIRAYVLPIGQYALASSFRLSVDTLYRELSITVGQFVQRFGLDRADDRIRRCWERGRYDDWVNVLHSVSPRYENYDTEGEQDEMEQPGPDHDTGEMELPEDPAEEGGFLVAAAEDTAEEPRGQDMGGMGMPAMKSGYGLPMQNEGPGDVEEIIPPEDMPWKSCWMNLDANDDNFLIYEGGFNEWPAMCCRWNITGEDVYGNSPGMDSLGDAKALQLYEKRKAQAIDKIVNPPMKAPSTLRGQRASILPGDVTYLDQMGPGTSFEPALIISPQIVQMMDATIREHEQRINGAFYADLWLAITNDQRSIPATAREIVERHEEKMLQLGPTLERIQDELLDPMIERIFAIMHRRGMIPPAPQEIANRPIRVEYISVMSKAQKLVGTAAVERMLQLAANIAPMKPDIVQKIDFDATLEEYADMIGTPPRCVKEQVLVDQERQAQAQAQADQQRMQAATVGAENTKTLANATLDQDNALSRLMTSIGASPVAGGLPQ